MKEHWTQRRVEFSDTDMGGLIHFSRYLVFMETAEHQFLNAVGSSVCAAVAEGVVSWPRLSCAAEFLRPVGFEDCLDIRTLVLRKGSRSLTFGCDVFHDGERVARGQMSSVCCIFGEGHSMQSIDIPPSLAERIEEVPGEEKSLWQPLIRPLSS